MVLKPRKIDVVQRQEQYFVGNGFWSVPIIRLNVRHLTSNERLMGLLRFARALV